MPRVPSTLRSDGVDYWYHGDHEGNGSDHARQAARPIMKQISMKGLVRLADAIRRRLAGPISAARRADLEQQATDTISSLDATLAANNGSLSNMAPQTRQAHTFLTRIAANSTTARATQVAEAPPQHRAFRFAGVKDRFEYVLDDLATATPTAHDRIERTIRRTSDQLEQQIAARNVQPEELNDSTRATRGWLAFFAERANLDAYLAALDRVNQAFEPALQRSKELASPPRIHFRPMKGLYRIRSYADCTLVKLPTPMIVLDSATFALLADMATRRTTGKQHIVEAMTGKPYQRVLAELEALGGVVEQPAGVIHDLGDAFDRVNQTYFGGKMSRPRLGWSRTPTIRKLGHYERIRDTVMVSASLDQADVPRFVVDFIVYHELLHKKLGIVWRNGRAMAHTPAFRQAESLFHDHAEAQAVLGKLAPRP